MKTEKSEQIRKREQEIRKQEQEKAPLAGNPAPTRYKGKCID
jgi:hypothetical protein